MLLQSRPHAASGTGRASLVTSRPLPPGPSQGPFLIAYSVVAELPDTHTHHGLPFHPLWDCAALWSPKTLPAWMLTRAANALGSDQQVSIQRPRASSLVLHTARSPVQRQLGTPWASAFPLS